MKTIDNTQIIVCPRCGISCMKKYTHSPASKYAFIAHIKENKYRCLTCKCKFEVIHKLIGGRSGREIVCKKKEK